jgi:hypothetical protein
MRSKYAKEIEHFMRSDAEAARFSFADSAEARRCAVCIAGTRHYHNLQIIVRRRGKDVYIVRGAYKPRRRARVPIQKEDPVENWTRIIAGRAERLKEQRNELRAAEAIADENECVRLHGPIPRMVSLA